MAREAMAARLLGAYGEMQAKTYLERKGFKILDMNFTCRFGEIDIVAQDRHTIIFVEVKTRRNGSFAQAREYVTKTKQRRVATAAELWLAQNPTKRQPRFDVVEVYAPEGYRAETPEIYHIEDAYEI